MNPNPLNPNPGTPSSGQPAASTPQPIVVGIDPGLDQHGVAALATATCTRLERSMFPNTIAGMQALVERLTAWRQQSGGALLVAMEEASAYGEALECYLDQAGFAVVVVSEIKVAGFKKALGSDANDLIDAEAIARFALVQPDHARQPLRQAVEADAHGSVHRQLRMLSRRHQRWTKDRTAAVNELHAGLRMAWLADYQRFFSDVACCTALTLWQAYPTPAEAATAKVEDLAALIRQASHGRFTLTECQAKAADLHGMARLLVFALGKRNPQRWSAWAEDIRVLARHLAHLNRELDALHKQMTELLRAIDSPLLRTRGIGAVTAAAIHGETLSIQRFATADRFARYNGTAPCEDTSGRRPRFVKNHRCNRRLRQAMMQLALNAPKYLIASQAYLLHLRSRGIVGGAARIRLARRLSDVIYAMLRDNRPYDLEYHMTHKKNAA